MKICHLALSLSPDYGGPAASIPMQCIGAKSLGIETMLITYKSTNSNRSILDLAGIPVIEVHQEKFIFASKLSLNIRTYLNKIDVPDIIHLHGVWLPFNYWGAFYANKHHIPYVINPRGDLEISRVERGFSRSIKKKLALYFYSLNLVNKASCLIATSQQEAEAIRHYKISSPIAIIPNGIDISAYPDGVRKKNHDKKVMLYLSRINPIKGLDLLIDAWRYLPDSIKKNWELHIVGNSDPADYVKKIEKKVEDYELLDSIKILGPITGDDKILKYLSSDIFILPTHNENFGNVVAEALMCELPVITTTNAPWGGLIDSNSGWWVDLSVENLVCAMTDAMTQTSEELGLMGKNGRRYIIDNFSNETVTKKTISLYNWILGDEEKPGFVQTTNCQD